MATPRKNEKALYLKRLQSRGQIGAISRIASPRPDDMIGSLFARFPAHAAALLVLALWSPVSPVAAAQTDAANVYMAGADVKSEAPVDGDLYAAAGRVVVAQPVRGD